MRSRAFIFLVAEAYAVEPKTVTIYARLLKEAGLLTSGARGVNAPDMTPLDAARITIALLATDKPGRCVEMLKRFALLPYIAGLSSGAHPDVWGISEGASLERVLTNLFSADLEAGDPFGTGPYLEIQENARTASIKYNGGGVFFQDRNRNEEQRDADRRDLFGIRRARGVASIEMLKLSVQFYLERRDGLTWEDRYKGCDIDGYPLDPAHPWNAELPAAEQAQRHREISDHIEARERSK